MQPMTWRLAVIGCYWLRRDCDWMSASDDAERMGMGEREMADTLVMVTSVSDGAVGLMRAQNL